MWRQKERVGGVQRELIRKVTEIKRKREYRKGEKKSHEDKQWKGELE